jgi:hypothetical protein
MANQVFANGMEIACKAGAGKVIAAFPDVCMTPPENPATPPGVPVPYPNTGFASDTTDGSKNVKISDEEIMLKNKSCFKTSVGDEAGCAAKKGVVSSKNTGKVYFIKWSMDVKVEGENVDRHLDMTTNNHGSPTANEGLPWIYIDTIKIELPETCREMVDNFKNECREGETYIVSRKPKKTRMYPDGELDRVISCDEACAKAQKCILIPKKLDKKWCCPETEGPLLDSDTLRTGHHLIEDQLVKTNPNFPWYTSSRLGIDELTVVPDELSDRDKSQDPPVAGVDDAPTVCSNTSRTIGTPHRELHDIQGVFIEQFNDGGSRAKLGQPSNGLNYGKLKDQVVLAHTATYTDSECSQQCIKDTLDTFYGSDDSRPMNLPKKAQDLGKDRRDGFHDTWGNINTGPLTQNPFANLKLP